MIAESSAAFRQCRRKESPIPLLQRNLSQFIRASTASKGNRCRQEPMDTKLEAT
jgi:hypothetical protein